MLKKSIPQEKTLDFKINLLYSFKYANFKYIIFNMKFDNKIIGISGVAGAGKDLFYTMLSRHVRCKRYALADKLKIEINPFCKKFYKIDLFNCNREEKDSLRELMVFHGKYKRGQTDGKYWTRELMKIIKRDAKSKKIPKDHIVCITDIRYSQYDNDEIYWLKNILGGSLVHVSQYELKLIEGKSRKTKVFKSPANAEERREDPKLKSLADHVVEWPRIEGKMLEVEKRLEVFVHEYIFAHHLDDYLIDKENYPPEGISDE